MACYIRHLSAILQEAGMADTKQNRREAHRIIQEVVGWAGEGCPRIWREVKVWLAQEGQRAKLISALREAKINSGG